MIQSFLTACFAFNEILADPEKLTSFNSKIAIDTEIWRKDNL
jgi:hypothetical protein